MNIPLPSTPPPDAGVAPPPPPSRPWYRKKRFLIPGALVALFVVAAIAVDPDDDDTATESAATAPAGEAEVTTTTSDPGDDSDEASERDDATESDPVETTQPVVDGSRESPLPLGQTASVGGDYEVAVVGVVADGTSEVMAANPFNEEPPEGEVYSLVRVRATFVGDGEGMPSMDLSVGYIGDDGRVYVDHDCWAVKPDSMLDQPRLVAGGTAEGNFCLQIPASVVGTGAVFVEPLFSFRDDKTWWADR
jgi:hypothetical protein